MCTYDTGTTPTLILYSTRWKAQKANPLETVLEDTVFTDQRLILLTRCQE